MLVKITYSFPNVDGCTIEVWEWISEFNQHYRECDCLIMAAQLGTGMLLQDLAHALEFGNGQVL